MSNGGKPWRIDSTPKRRPVFFGYERELALVQYLAQLAQGQPVPAYAFGYPGVGKSSFWQVVAWELEQKGIRCSLLTIYCDSIANMPTTDALFHIDAIRNRIREELGKVGRLLIVIFDEIDLMVHKAEPQAIGVQPSRNTVTSYAISLINGFMDAGRGLFLVGATNYPDSVDCSVDSRINWHIYFPPPAPRILVEILRHKLEVRRRQAEDILDCYQARCEADNTVPMTRRLMTATEQFFGLLAARISGPSPMPNPQVVADLLYITAPPPLRTSVEDWKRPHNARITASEGLKDLIGGPGEVHEEEPDG